MQAIESEILNWYPEMSDIWSKAHPRGILSSTQPGGNFTALPESTKKFIVRSDNAKPDTQINVFDSAGNQIYSIERYSAHSTLWTVYKVPSREQVAAVRCGLFQREVLFSNKEGIHARSIGSSRLLYGGLPDRRFYLDDGAPYEWSRENQYLEKIINPGGGREETRVRIALAKLLRQGRFEWELIVDENFDTEIALTTALISMLTAWKTSKHVVPGVTY